jgi:hypothetical protein
MGLTSEHLVEKRPNSVDVDAWFISDALQPFRRHVPDRSHTRTASADAPPRRQRAREIGDAEVSQTHIILFVE